MELPRTVQEIADVIGRERALYLIGQLPRSRVKSKQYYKVLLYVPKNISLDNSLVKILGWTDAEKLVKHFGGEIIHVPNCEYIYKRFIHRTIARMSSEGVSVKVIAEILGVTERTVYRHCADKPHEDITPANDNSRTNHLIKVPA